MFANWKLNAKQIDINFEFSHLFIFIFFFNVETVEETQSRHKQHILVGPCLN